jgi:hypothetical protein
VLDLGGNITFNGARIYSNSDIQARNRSGRIAQFSSIITDKNSSDPLIEIRNTYNPPPTGLLASAPPPDIEIRGLQLPMLQGRFES